jgi:SOS-response transcriptional repressor LexA
MGMEKRESGDLTERQVEVLQYIIDQISKTGLTPTVRQIGRHLRLRFANGAFYQIQMLERKGYIRRDKGQGQRGRFVVLRRPNGESRQLDIQRAIAALKKYPADTRIEEALAYLGE